MQSTVLVAIFQVDTGWPAIPRKLPGKICYSSIFPNVQMTEAKLVHKSKISNNNVLPKHIHVR